MDTESTERPICRAPGELTESTVNTGLKVNLPEAKQTLPGLYVTAAEAYQKWQCASKGVNIIDVRTVEEYLFVGSPPMAWRIPVATQSYEWNNETKNYPMAPLLDFAARVRTVLNLDDTLMVLCRSGGRSAQACNMLSKAGFNHVYNIVDGMEGDGQGDSEGEPRGGWKNTGCPWTKKITPERMVLPHGFIVERGKKICS